MTNLFQFLDDQAVQFFRHHRDALLAISQDTMTGARKPSRKPGSKKHSWPVERTAAFTGSGHSISIENLRINHWCGEVQAILAVWLVAVAGVHPVEEEGVNGGSAGGAFAWREAEESGKTRRWFSRAIYFARCFYYRLD